MPLRSGRRRRAHGNADRLGRDDIAELYRRDSSARLVVLVGSQESGHDSGSVAVAVARNWAAHGRDVLFVDADASGSALAHRLGQATRASFSPAIRGLPSLMAARRPLTAELLREHCWRLSAQGNGAVSLLLGPTSIAGARLAATWLSDCTASFLDANEDRHVVVSQTIPLERGQEAFIRAASAVVLVAPAGSDEHFDTLCALGESLVAAAEHCSPCLVIDGASERSFEQIRTSTGMHVAGQLDSVPEQVLLRNRPRRRDAKAAQLVDELAARVAFLAAGDTRERQERAA